MNPNVLREWKKIAIKGLPDDFNRRGSMSEAKAVYERLLDESYPEIGRLTTNLSF